MKKQVTIERNLNTKEEFIMVYLSDCRSLFGSISNTSIRLLALIWRDCEFSKAKNLTTGNTIVLRKPVKQVWCDELKVSMGSVNNMITQMIKEGILIEQASPIYTLDPKRFFKGSEENRLKSIDVVYSYLIEEGI